MMKLLGSKKGMIAESASAIVFMFIFGFILLFCYYFLVAFIAGVNDAGVGSTDITNVGNSFLFGLRMMDYLGILFLFGLIAGVGIVSYRIASAPVYLIIVLVGSAFLGLVGYIFSFIFSQYASQTMFTAILVYFPRTLLICTNLHWVGLLTLIVGSITMYGKRDVGQYE